MCFETFLNDILQNKIDLPTLFKWFSNSYSATTYDSPNEPQLSQCSRYDFAFLYQTHLMESLQRCSSYSAANKVSPQSTRVVNSEADKQKKDDTSNNKFKTSCNTPKSNKNHLNESYRSPVFSPIYKKHNFMTPRNVQLSPSPRACLGDYLSVTGSNSKNSSNKKKKRNDTLGKKADQNAYIKSDHETPKKVNAASFTNRRINPTNLQHLKPSNFNPSNSFNFNDIKEVKCEQELPLQSGDNKRRSYFVEECKILATPQKIVPDALITRAISKSKLEIQPSPKAVTSAPTLDTLITIYRFLRDNNFILNILSDANLLLSVACGRIYDYTPYNGNSLGLPFSTKLDEIFKSVHNRVYFSVNILETQLWHVFDRATLTFLVENARLKPFFSESFIEEIGEIRERKHIIDDKKLSTKRDSPGQRTYVCFDSETDNADNFSSTLAFQTFRKQRDMFYEILRIWENGRANSGWNFSMALSGKIKALLSTNEETCNMTHLARLFKAQLLVDVCTSGDGARSNNGSNTIGNGNLTILSSVHNLDTDKLSRLNSRIENAANLNNIGVNSPPEFVGCEEFYKNFLTVSLSYVFIRHTIDVFTREIKDLVEKKVIPSDLDKINSFSNKYLKSNYETYIKSLNVLVKFLGFLETLPYWKDQVRLTGNFLNSQIETRSNFVSSINLKHILQDSIENNSLILTIPWIAKYLAMLDPVTLRLPYFDDIYCILFEIYFKSSSAQDYNFNLYHTYLIKFSLDWLFNLSHFPKEKYYVWLWIPPHSLQHKSLTSTKGSHDKSLNLDDYVDIIDQNVLYLCCPYLEEFKVVLYHSGGAVPLKNKTAAMPVRHIRPISSAVSTSPLSLTDTSNKKTLAQIEEAFLVSHSLTMRKTIEFVCERVASISVRHICDVIVPMFKVNALHEFRSAVNSLKLKENVADLQTCKQARAIGDSLATYFLEQLLEELRVKGCGIFGNRITQGLSALLGDDILEQTKQVSLAIAEKRCLERIQHWIDSNILVTIFVSEFKLELKKLKIRDEEVSNLTNHANTSGEFCDGFKIIKVLRFYSLDLIEKCDINTFDCIEKLLDEIDTSVRERLYSDPTVTEQVLKLLFNLCILLVAHRPSVILNDSILNKFCSIWICANCKNLIYSVINPRNFIIISKSSEIEESHKALRHFILALVDNKLITYEMLDGEISKVNKECLDKVSMNSCFLTNLLEECKKLEQE